MAAWHIRVFLDGSAAQRFRERTLAKQTTRMVIVSDNATDWAVLSGPGGGGGHLRGASKQADRRVSIESETGPNLGESKGWAYGAMGAWPTTLADPQLGSPKARNRKNNGPVSIIASRSSMRGL